MVVGVLLLRLEIPNSGSLKDKRAVIKSLQARLGQQFGVSVAEVGEQAAWRAAELGVALATNQVSFAEQMLDAVIRYVEETRPDVEIQGADREVSTFFQ